LWQRNEAICAIIAIRFEAFRSNPMRKARARRRVARLRGKK
jgi:hypothetical protein